MRRNTSSDPECHFGGAFCNGDPYPERGMGSLGVDGILLRRYKYDSRIVGISRIKTTDCQHGSFVIQLPGRNKR